MLITHCRADWWPESALYSGPVQKPARTRLADLNAPYDRSRMAADMAKPLAVAARTGLPLYCGEFGIAWANWDYKGGFALVQNGESAGIAEALLGAGGR
jgi:hypothetical protein